MVLKKHVKFYKVNALYGYVNAVIELALREIVGSCDHSITGHTVTQISSPIGRQNTMFFMFCVMLEVIQLRNLRSERQLCISHLTQCECVYGRRFGTSCHRSMASPVP